MQRRTWLRRTGWLAAVGVAGCLGGENADTPASPTEQTPAGQTTTAESEPATASDRTTSSDSTTTSDPATSSEPTTATATEIHSDYETTQVAVETPDGQLLGSVTAAIADTAELRHLGLSDTPSLPDDRGMLFVYDQVSDRTFVMRRMSFGLDIIYADADGVITTIHHASEPGPDEDGNEQRYPGRGQYVLEVNIDWTTERGVSEGDVLSFTL